MTDVELCPTCGQPRVETRHCKRCHAVFFVRGDERRFFESKGLLVPTHCPTCRRERRLMKEEAAQRPEGEKHVAAGR
jgi:hypothetical protein